MFDLAGPVGTLAGGFISDRLLRSHGCAQCVCSILCLSISMPALRYLPPTRLAVGFGRTLTCFLMYISASRFAGAAAIDCGTKKGASTASGLVNGLGSLGQIVGVTLPGWAGSVVGKGHEIWNPIFLWLGIALGVAGFLLMPQ